MLQFLLFFFQIFSVLESFAQIGTPEKSFVDSLNAKPGTHELKEVEIVKANPGSFKAVEGFTIYESKKSELIEIKNLTTNLATNNTRQVFAKIPGLNIWESDGAGLQLGIGTRGLSPSRTANFNTRQNGYDISADALGYPESYYTPALEAIEKIELLRGAASLQYGTQFGGMLNFIMKKGVADRTIQAVSKQTLGSFRFFNSFNSIGGTIKKLNYYAYYQYKTGTGWRENSGFMNHTAYANMTYKFNQKFTAGIDYSWMTYLAQQPGGLTDKEFQINPRQSSRDRNWFQVHWNLAAVWLNYQITEKTKLNTRSFGLIADRISLGNLQPINRYDDPISSRTMIDDQYKNLGNETRILHRYNIYSMPSTLLAGVRVYLGNTYSGQGNADNGAGAHFKFDRPGYLENFKYAYPGSNVAVFAENILNLNNHWSFTPGVRYDYIATFATGYYNNVQVDDKGETIQEIRSEEQLENKRSILLFGAGSSYKFSDVSEIYGNASQNYRAITFSDMRIENKNQKIDANLQDERGYNLDLGIRGKVAKTFKYDAGIFYLNYNQRIGLIPQIDTVSFVEYAYRTNVGNSITYGLESYTELLLPDLHSGTSREISSSLFANISLINGRYIQSANKNIVNKKVELTPPVQIRLGANLKFHSLKIAYQFSYTASQYSDALNTERYSNAVIGIIPSYKVMDLTAQYSWKILTASASINNLLNASYFTRRAASYPGPGIIPSDGRSVFVTVGVTL